jgi:LPXTG-motif cell wall-anchored protein
MPPTTGDVVFGITVNWWSVLTIVAIIVVGFWLWRRRKRRSKGR